MTDRPLRTTVIGSYPFPGWLELASGHLDALGSADLAEMQQDAVTAAVHDQLAAGVDVLTDGEQSRLDFNLSFYGHLRGVAPAEPPARRFGPPAHDQRGKHALVGPLDAPAGLGVTEELARLHRVVGALRRASDRPVLKCSVPGPYTLAGRLIPNEVYPDRDAITEALLPLVRAELTRLADGGAEEITVDEPSMSCYAHREDPRKLVDIFNRTVEPVVGRTRLSTHLCFGNYKGRAVGRRCYAPLFPAFHHLKVDEVHLEMASREFSQLELIGPIAEHMRVAVGLVDVKSYFIESPEDVAQRVRMCLDHAPADRLSFAPDCGLSQTARWAARQKLENLVAGVERVRRSEGGSG